MGTKHADLRTLDIVFFDTEFSGLTFAHELLEIGFVKAKAGTLEVIEEGDIKIKPERIEIANPQALEINGYNEAEWEQEGVDLKSGLTEFLRHTDGALLCGHNMNWDVVFLQKSLAACGLTPNFHYKILDTLSMAVEKFYKDPKFKTFSLLTELAPHFKVDTGREHRAIDDARTTYQVFKHLLSA